MAKSGTYQEEEIKTADMHTPDYSVDYNDPRFGKVESDRDQALTDLENTYGGMIGSSDSYFDQQIQASKDWTDKQSQLQQEQTDFALEQIQQQKDQAHKDYLKEQSGAFVDWRKQSNQYGTEAEKMASAGLANTGYSESSQVSMYNTYQNRVATAREVYNRAVLNYNNAMKDAQLQNNAALAEIAYNALQKQLELSLQGFQYKNQLILEQANKKTELDNMYYNRYQDVLQQINTENAMAEEVRQYNANMEMQIKQFNEQVRQFEQNYQLEIDKYNESIRQFNEEIARLKKKDEQEYKLQIQQLELQKQKMAQEKAQFEQQMQIQREQLAEQKRQFNAQQAAKSVASAASRVSSSANKSKSSTKKASASVSKAATVGNYRPQTYEDATAYLKSKGVTGSYVSGVMTANEWSRRKNANSSYAGVKNYSSYQAYLADYVKYGVSQYGK